MTRRKGDITPRRRDGCAQLVEGQLEDLRMMTSRPYFKGGFRWFRSPNVRDLEAYRERIGAIKPARYAEKALVVRFVRRRRVG
jgi:hypothetical protein